jgi:hypothetical protein
MFWFTLIYDYIVKLSFDVDIIEFKKSHKKKNNICDNIFCSL